jgi:hypothetical protein
MRHRIALLVCLTAALALPTLGTGARSAPAGRFVVVYAAPRNQDERTLVSLIKASQLSQVMAQFSKVLIIPRDVTIYVAGGLKGVTGPFYSPSKRIIVFPHEFSAFVFRWIGKAHPKITPYDFGVAFASIEYFVLLHEMGHSLVHLWELPVLGREEDAVDGFSTIFMTEFVPNGGDIALWAAELFDYLGRNEAGLRGQAAAEAFADEHSLSSQRAYSIACWVYGSNTKKYAGLSRVIPRSRLVRCKDEYAQLRRSWLKLLRPHVRSA